MKEKLIRIKSLEETEGGATFDGWLSTYGNKDRDGDIIFKGAFSESIEKKSTIPCCFNHNRDVVLGKLELVDTEKGLFFSGTLNTKDTYALNIQSLIDLGALDSMSIGMLIKEYEPIDPKRPFGGWNILKAEAFEGSIVTVPANELATINKELSDKERAELESLRSEKRLEGVNKLLTQAQGLLAYRPERG